MTATAPLRPSLPAAWLSAARPRTLGASLVPVAVGSAAAAAENAFQPAVALACALVALLLQLATNLANDALDFLAGVDRAGRAGPLRVTQAGWLAPRSVLTGAALCTALAAAVGLWLVARGGLPVAILGAACVAGAWSYSAGPFPLAARGLGELAALLFFGLIAVVATSALQSGAIRPLAVVASLPVGLLVATLMGVNNLRDIATDRAAGKRTLAVRLGEASWRRVLRGAVLAALAIPPLAALCLGLPGLLLSLLALPLARAWRVALDASSGPALNAVLAATARLHAVHGLLIAVGLLV